MSNSGGERQPASVRDLVEEAKKRIVFLVVCVVGLSYLMSLTSASVLVNLPAAMFLIILLRYMSWDFEMRRKAASYKGKAISANGSSKAKPFVGPRVVADRSEWKHKVNSPAVEDAIDQLMRHIVSEWVTDLWYSRITPDKQGPEELVLILNGVLGEISSRMRNINLIDLLTRDIVNLLSSRLELFRETKTKIEMRQSSFLSADERDIKLKSFLAAENKLHPILFSAEAEHRVLQHVMDGLILFTFKQEELQCSFFRYVARELLACVVIRPVLNLASPKFINERVESLVISAKKPVKESKGANKESQSRTSGSSRILSDDILQSPDPSMKGVELVQVKKEQYNKASGKPAFDSTLLSKDPLLSMDTRSTRSWNSLPEVQNGEESNIQRHRSGGEWGDKLDVFSRRKTEALAPENFDNMWTKGRDYKRNEDTNQLADPAGAARQKKKEGEDKVSNKGPWANNAATGQNLSKENCSSVSLHKEAMQSKSASSDEVESWSSSFTEDEDTDIITGLDSPSVKVWDGKSKRNFSRIHHPLETFDLPKSKKSSRGYHHSKGVQRTKSTKKRSRSSNHNEHVWQEVERTSFLLGDGQDVLSSSKVNGRPGDLSEDSESELLGGIHSGVTTSSSMSLASLPESHTSAASSAKYSVISNPFFRLRCEVIGANIVRSGSKTFAVYSISVTDVNGNNWSIKRRFQHFEELHRRLKEFSEYNLHLPPKHFLSTGLDVLVIQERCILLDQYLKRLLQLPTVSASIEVWDFLSVDSQMYIFSDSLSIIDTLSVRENNQVPRENLGPVTNPLSTKTETLGNGNQDFASRVKGDRPSDGSILCAKGQALSSSKKPEKEFRKDAVDPGSDSEKLEQKSVLASRNLDRDQQSSHSVGTSGAASDSTIPSEWVPPNLSVPMLDLVDVILQLKDGGWIRRKAFWVAKQVLQLGMGDAFDDWLIEKIQVLRRGSVVASGVRKLEQILWPDGIFITKHPKRQQPSSSSPSDSSPKTPYSSPKVDDAKQLEEVQQKEAERRAKLVYELMIDKAPAAIVGLVGRKEYEKCAKDLYYFIQSSVFMKLLAFDLLELLLLSAFPELDYVFRQLNEEKEKFGGKLALN